MWGGRIKGRIIILATILILSVIAIAAEQKKEVIKPKDALQYVGQVKTVCGKVASTFFAGRSRGRPTFLNLDKPYPNQTFTVVIWGRDRGKFEVPPEVLFMGKEICVTGRITTYRGKPQITVSDPSQITLIEK